MCGRKYAVKILIFVLFSITVENTISQNDNKLKTETQRSAILQETDQLTNLLPIDLENSTCISDADCMNILPNIMLALDTRSSTPSSPYCLFNTEPEHVTYSQNRSGHCTCGPDKCVSYTLRIGRSTPYYYCGPCSHVGAQCTNGTCAHEMAECKDAYCQCIKNGEFYEFNYCKIPYMVYETSLQAGIIVCIVIVLILIFSSFYTASGLQAPCCRHRDSQSTTQRSLSDDMPPNYEELTDSLPTYNDAIQMENQVGNEDIKDTSSVTQRVTRRNSQPSTPGHQEFENDNNDMSSYICEDNFDNISVESSSTFGEQDEPRSSLANRSSSASNSDIGYQPIELVLHEALNKHINC